MSPAELQQLLRDFYLDRVALLMQHESAARFVTDYDVNNAYQYIISREETHVSWLQHALLDLGAQLPPDPKPSAMSPPRKRDDAYLEIAGRDAQGNHEFVTKWRDRVEEVSNARQKGMLRVVLGEMLEHQRLFAQAADGRKDIIGTALPINEHRGKVLDRRWIE